MTIEQKSSIQTSWRKQEYHCICPGAQFYTSGGKERDGEKDSSRRYVPVGAESKYGNVGGAKHCESTRKGCMATGSGVYVETGKNLGHVAVANPEKASALAGISITLPKKRSSLEIIVRVL